MNIKDFFVENWTPLGVYFQRCTEVDGVPNDVEIDGI